MLTNGTVLSNIDDAVARTPQNVAVRTSDGDLTYSELSTRAERLAHHLGQLGVRPGDLVGQCVDRSASLIVAALGILRAGAAYVAIDPAYPDERVRWMLDDSAAAAAVVADAGTPVRPRGLGDRPTVALAAGGELPHDRLPAADAPAPAPPLPTDAAYVVYTSGSTGQPKGVVIEHASLMNLVAWHRATFALAAHDRCTQIASPGFDAAVWEIWPALTSGATIHVVPEELRRDPIGLRDWLVAEGITVTFLPTAVAEGIIGLSWPETETLRYLLTGGDALTRRPPAGLPFSVVNNYGVSEAAVVATSGVVPPTGVGLPTIGRPISGVTTEVVDEHLEPVGPGMAGELVIGGPAVGRGYLNQPALTRERFLDEPRGRRYRTGDHVRLRPDGELEFLGRRDDQLSIRGFRVEAGEVVAALSSHPQIETAVVLGAGSSGADRQLVAYVVPAAAERPDGAGLDTYLARFLPDHMLPSRYVWLDALPLTQHGKVDRDALPDPVDVTAAGSTGRPPATPVEAKLATIVAELLEIDGIGMEQNFFLLGGHSLLGAQLIIRLEDQFGVEISLRYLFDHPTPAELAAEVEQQLAHHAADLVSG